tara:strand:- start:1607 stop:2476 length:870 start_codon:yes stop_codon:yes gene_type:complete
MAVKPITNPYPKADAGRTGTGEFNRATDVSARFNRGNGNARQTIPTKDITNNFSVSLKDIDTTMMNHLKTHMIPQMNIREGNEMIKIPVFYGNQERWANINKNGVIRDRNNVLIMPMIMFRRTNMSFTDAMPFSHDWDVKGERVLITRAQRYSPKNRYDRFAVQQGKQPMFERMTTGAPDWVDVTYEFVVLTSYIEQMNSIIETFSYHENTYFGTGTDFKFIGSVEGGFSDASEISIDQQRVVKTTFTWMLKGYLLPETSNQQVHGHIFELGKSIGPVNVVIGKESIVD